jgi:TctA family transporter
MLENLTLGFSVALGLNNVLYALAGALLGTLIGVLPGIGPITTIALLLPLTFGLSPDSAMILLAGIYYGAQYGGSTTAILVRMPGEASSVVTTLDGHAMAIKGRAGPALAIAAIGSFLAGCFSTVLIAIGAPMLSKVALNFQSPEYFSLMILGLIAAVALSGDALFRAIAMVLLGILFGLVGTDVSSGTTRFTFDYPLLYEGISFVVLTVGLFALPELVKNVEEPTPRVTVKASLRNLLPSRSDTQRRSCVDPSSGRHSACFLAVAPS